MLEFHVSTIVFTVINLLVLYVFLRKFLFGRINAVLDRRAALVREEIASAEASSREAGELKARYEEQLAGARREADRIVADARTRAQRAYEGRLAEAAEDARRLQSEAEARIAAEREEMLQGARSEVASLALLAAARVVRRSVDGDDNRALVDEFLSEVGERT